ncbi:MAG: thioredoxin domain-containing protein [Bryobacteraceae bacterium]|jgi:protein-disulfide isomerase
MRLCSLVLAAFLPCLAAGPQIDPGKVLGSTTAPVTIELFSSFACTHCKEFHDTILPQIVRDYVARGKVCVVSRECFNLSAPGAQDAARYATAAVRIGKYQEVADALFKKQPSWIANGQVWGAVASVLTLAEQQKVQALSKDPAVAAEVQRDLTEAAAAGVTQTPTMVITRGITKYPFPGVPEYRLLRSLLDDILSK